MQYFPPALETLVEQFAKLPGVGVKSAQRLAFYVLSMSEEDANAFCLKAKKYDLILVPSDNFGVPGYFRMAYCIDTEKVQRSIPVLEKFVAEEYGVR